MQKNKIRQILCLGEHIVDNKLVITKEPKHYCFDLPKDADNILDHEIIKHDELLAYNTIKNEVRQLFPKYKHRPDIHKHRKQ